MDFSRFEKLALDHIGKAAEISQLYYSEQEKTYTVGLVIWAKTGLPNDIAATYFFIDFNEAGEVVSEKSWTFTGWGEFRRVGEEIDQRYLGYRDYSSQSLERTTKDRKHFVLARKHALEVTGKHVNFGKLATIKDSSNVMAFGITILERYVGEKKFGKGYVAVAIFDEVDNITDFNIYDFSTRDEVGDVITNIHSKYPVLTPIYPDDEA